MPTRSSKKVKEKGIPPKHSMSPRQFAALTAICDTLVSSMPVPTDSDDPYFQLVGKRKEGSQSSSQWSEFYGEPRKEAIAAYFAESASSLGIVDKRPLVGPCNLCTRSGGSRAIMLSIPCLFVPLAPPRLRRRGCFPSVQEAVKMQQWQKPLALRVVTSVKASRLRSLHSTALAPFHSPLGRHLNTRQLCRPFVQVATTMKQCVKPLPLAVFSTVLWLLSTRLGTLLLAGRRAFTRRPPFVQPFAKLSPQAREAVLLQWSVSSNFLLRTVFKVGSRGGGWRRRMVTVRGRAGTFRSFTLFHVGAQHDGSGNSMLWRAMGYCGPDPNMLAAGKHRGRDSSAACDPDVAQRPAQHADMAQRPAQQSDRGEGEAEHEEEMMRGDGESGGCGAKGGEARPLDEAVVDCAAEGEGLAAVLQGKGVEVLPGPRQTIGLLGRRDEGEGEVGPLGEPVVVRCDAVVIGSGCGGAIIAAQLAEAAAAAGGAGNGGDDSGRRRKVLVLEAGGYFFRSDLSLLEAPSAQICEYSLSCSDVSTPCPAQIYDTENGSMLNPLPDHGGWRGGAAGKWPPSLPCRPPSCFPPSPGSRRHDTHEQYDTQGFLTTEDGGVALLAGRTVGGGSAVNWSASFRTPPHVTKEWAGEYGLKQFESPEYAAAMDAVCEKIQVTADETLTPHSLSNAALKAGCAALGCHHAVTPRNTNQPHPCAWCTFGCWSGEKQSMLETWLPDAVTHGAIILSRCAALRLLLSPNRPASTTPGATSSSAAAGVRRRKRVVGVEARVEQQGVWQRVVVEANLVVVACGSLHTPPLLLASGLTNRAIGASLRLHPVTSAWGFFPETAPSLPPSLPAGPGYLGPIMSVNSRETANWETSGYGAMIQTPTIHPGLLGCAIPWLGSQTIKQSAVRFDRIASLISIVRDRGRGTVRVDGSGRPVVTYRLCKEDQKSMQEALLLSTFGSTQNMSLPVSLSLFPDALFMSCYIHHQEALLLSLRILRAAGAVEVGTLHQSLKPFRCLIPPTVDADTADENLLAAKAKLKGSISLEGMDGWQCTSDTEFEAYLKSVVAAGFKLNDCTLFSAHQTGSCPMGTSPKNSVVDENGESWEVSGLFVGDGSVFPTPVGVNPMVSIESVAFMIGKRLADRVRNGEFSE
ncbi:unnamed protein product [Closterium sp. NIES-65]|nr:unnamed protein product [Closterium sp. NIES-65]